MSEQPSDVATPPKRVERKPVRFGGVRTIAGALIGAVTAIFAFLNLDRVQVDWLVGSASTPLILVIAISMLAGVLLDRLLVATRKRKRDD